MSSPTTGAELGKTILTAADVARVVDRIAHQILEKTSGAAETVLLGIPTRGVPLARRLAARIAAFEGLEIPVGVLDITLYRDDLMRHTVGPQPLVRLTDIPFSIDDRRILLVDDVLFTGRTIRSALDALIDFGRPRAIQLVALIDRGHRELPIRADYVGRNIPTSRQQSVQVRLQERGMSAPDPQALPHAVTEDESRVEHRHHRPVAGQQLAVDPDHDGVVAWVVRVVVRAVGHARQPRRGRLTP